MISQTTSQPAMSDTLDPSEALAGLAKTGAVLIRRRGTTENDYIQLGESLARSQVHHATGTGERDLVRPDANISTINKGSDAIPLHREASYLPDTPDILSFYCDQPPETGGQTTLCDGVNLLNALPESVRDYVETGPGAELVWRWNLPFERWSAAFRTRSPRQVEDQLARLRRGFTAGQRLDTHFDGDQLHGVYRTRAVIETRFGQLPAFCNSVMAFYYRDPGPYVALHLYHVSLADGSAFPPDTLATIRDRAEHLTYQVSWEAGDILLVDNSRFMHGRRPVADTHRRILVRLGMYHDADHNDEAAHG